MCQAVKGGNLFAPMRDGACHCSRFFQPLGQPVYGTADPEQDVAFPTLALLSLWPPHPTAKESKLLLGLGASVWALDGEGLRGMVWFCLGF